MASFSGDSIIGIAVSLILLVLLIANAVYLNAVREELNDPNSTAKLSKTGADVLFVINIILIIVMTMYLIYNMWRVFTTTEQRATVKKVVTTSGEGRFKRVRRIPVKTRGYTVNKELSPKEIQFVREVRKID